MQKMIREYKEAKALLQKRIRELNKVMKEEKLTSNARDNLEIRKGLLQYEATELMHVINELESHLPEAAK